MIFSFLPRLLTVVLSLLLLNQCTYYHSQQATTQYKKLDPAVAEQMKSNLSLSLPKEMVEAHNVWRQKASVAQVTWSSALADKAQNWAETLRKKNCQLTSNPNRGDYNENLAQTLGTRFLPTEVVTVWGEEGVYYDDVTQRCQTGKNCIYYKHLIAAETQKIGCGIAFCGSVQVWVCYYD